MPSYVVESYLSNSPAAVADARGRAHLAAELEESIRYVRTTFLPGDEVVLHLFDAPGDDAVRRAARRAELPYDRIVEAVEGPPIPTESEQ